MEDLEDKFPENQRQGVLESLAGAYQLLGRHLDAADALARATSLGVADAADRVYLLAAEATARANAGDFSRAGKLLQQLPAIQRDNQRALLVELTAWTVLLSARSSEGRRNPVRLKALLAEVSALGLSAVKERHHFHAQAIYEALAYFCDALGKGAEASASAQTAQQQASAQKRPPNPIMNLLVVAELFAKGETAEARTTLATMPKALSGRYGGVSDQEAALAGLGDLKRWFERAVRAAVESRSEAVDLRVLMELRREAFRHARPAGERRAIQETLYGSLGDAALERIAPAHGRLLVIEWLDLGGGVRRPRLTVLQRGFAPATHDFEAPPVTPAEIGEAMLTRLEYSVGEADPFDWPKWRTLEAWTFRTFRPHIAPGDHLVFIEDHSSGHVPWHAIFGPLLPVSYAQSWSMLLGESVRPNRSRQALGFVMTPKRGDRQAIVDSFASACVSLEAIASEAGITLHSARGGNADCKAALSVIDRSYFAAILCHGIYEKLENEVGLLVAEDGQLPSESSPSATGRARNRHRLSWRNIAGSDGAASVIVSAACASGAGHFAGLGERLGMFREFHRIGGRSLIAPRWKSHAPAACALIVDVARRHLLQGETLGVALRNASSAAIFKGVPPRHAWNLALEGGWA